MRIRKHAADASQFPLVGMPGATDAIATISFLALDAALLGKGPFAGQSPTDTAFALQNYLLLPELTALENVLMG